MTRRRRPATASTAQDALLRLRRLSQIIPQVWWEAGQLVSGILPQWGDADSWDPTALREELAHVGLREWLKETDGATGPLRALAHEVQGLMEDIRPALAEPSAGVIEGHGWPRGFSPDTVEQLTHLRHSARRLFDAARLHTAEHLMAAHRSGRGRDDLSRVIETIVRDAPGIKAPAVLTALRDRAEKGDPLILAVGEDGRNREVGLDRLKPAVRNRLPAPLPARAIVWRRRRDLDSPIVTPFVTPFSTFRTKVRDARRRASAR